VSEELASRRPTGWSGFTLNGTGVADGENQVLPKVSRSVAEGGPGCCRRWTPLGYGGRSAGTRLVTGWPLVRRSWLEQG
jgi:hypothetical protein